MAKTREGMNGFGRIGRNFFRAHLERGGEFELVAINDLGDAKTMGHLLKYDSVLGQLDEDVVVGDGVITAGTTELKVLSERDPANLPWRDLEIELVIEDLRGKVDGISVRAPVPVGSITDLVVRLGRETTVDQVNEVYRGASESGRLAGILLYADDPLVSTDIIHSQYSCIVDSELTMANGNLVKVFGWYDNEWGYSCRLVDVVSKVAADIPAAVSA